jgi:nicotinate-nucleotide adenylyltransferase
VLLIPAAIPPHKSVEQEPGAEHRLQMCRLAVGDDERFAVSDVELRRRGPSYTADTLAGLSSHAPTDELVLILGGDIAAGLPDWHEPERVLELATVAIAERRGTPREKIERALATLRGSERARFFEMPRIEISSTMVRRRVGEGLPIRYFVPDQVLDYVEREGLYRSEVPVTAAPEPAS